MCVYIVTYISPLCSFLMYIMFHNKKVFKKVKLKEKSGERDPTIFLSLDEKCMEQLFKDCEK